MNHWCNPKPLSETCFDPNQGPQYPALGEKVQKWRRLEDVRRAAGESLTDEEKRAYGRAVHEAIRGLNHTSKPYAPISMKSTAIKHADIGRAQTAALHAQVAKDRRERNYLFAPNIHTDYSGTVDETEWDKACKRAYAEAMAAKRDLTNLTNVL